jgi:hypothetical protein
MSMREVWRKYEKARAALDELHGALEKLDRKMQQSGAQK